MLPSFHQQLLPCFLTCHYRKTYFFYESTDVNAKPWFFSFTFVIASCTIVSGCLAERTRLLVYPLFTVVISAWVHPLLAHWFWSPNGWTNTISSCTVLDFAGGSIVHIVGEWQGWVLGRWGGGMTMIGGRALLLHLRGISVGPSATETRFIAHAFWLDGSLVATGLAVSLQGGMSIAMEGF